MPIISEMKDRPSILLNPNATKTNPLGMKALPLYSLYGSRKLPSNHEEMLKNEQALYT